MLEAAKRRIIDRLGINRVAAHADRLQAHVDRLRVDAAALRDELERVHRALDERTGELATLTQVVAASARATAVGTPDPSPTISVVMATRDRSSFVTAAIESVLAQTYPDWQLVVVDDGSTDDTLAVLARHDDPRIEVIRTTGVGAAAARNAGIEAATGDWVTFLDDDNLMAPQWLAAIADHAGRHPGCRLLYGAQVRERETGGAPSDPTLDLLFVTPFDPARIREHNYIDLGALAVDRSHPELRFDESLEALIDWELIVRAAAVTAPAPIPVVAGIYRTHAPGRISDSAAPDETGAVLRARFAGD